ncbi:MAG: hypothetical protein SFY56_14140 [Bacteroidota bacterium]|nr:hypothetical protein [Bacteroidota bacterium]
MMKKLVKLILPILLFASFISFSQTKEIKGTIDSKKGNTLVISMKESPVKKGDKLILLKFTDGKIGKMAFTSWLDIANVSIVSNTNDKITLTIDKENSVTTLNGKKVDHFTKGSEVKFARLN